MRFFAFVGLFVMCFVSNLYAIDSLSGVRLKFDERLKEINSEFEDKKSEIFKKYQNSLEALESNIKAKGDLDGLLVLRNEIERFKHSTDLATTNVVDSMKNLGKIQKICLKYYGNLKLQRSNDVLNLGNIYDSVLKKMEREYTAKGDLEKALLVREERKRLELYLKSFAETKYKITMKKKGDKKDEKKNEMSFKSSTTLIEGFKDVVVSSNSGKYSSYRNKSVMSYWAQMKENQFIEWKTAKVENVPFAKHFDFVWAGLTYLSWKVAYRVFLNGTEIISVDKGATKNHEWENGNVKLKFISVGAHANHGIFQLTVPAPFVKKGYCQIIRIEPIVQDQNDNFILIHSFADVIKDLETVN